MVNMPTFQWSDVQRDPTKVEKAVHTHGRVALQRRGRSPLVLLDSDEQDATTTAVSAAAALLGALLATDRGFPTDALLQAFPWAAVFDEKHRRAMARELADMGLGGAALGDLRAFDTAVKHWRNTAEAKAAGVDLETPIDTARHHGSPQRPKSSRPRKSTRSSKGAKRARKT